MSTTETTYNPNAINIRLFHYTKGSMDYPLNHGTNDKFGFNTGSVNELPIYDYTIKDVITSIENTRIIDNLMIVNSGTDFNPDITIVDGDIVTSNKNKKESISSFIFDLGDNTSVIEKELYEQTLDYVRRINPNFDVTSDDIQATVSNPFEGSSHNIFWSKMFALIETLKKYEAQLVDGKFPSILKGGTNNTISLVDSNGELDRAGFITADLLSDYDTLSDKNTLDAYLAMFFGSYSNRDFIGQQNRSGKLKKTDYFRANSDVWEGEEVTNFWKHFKDDTDVEDYNDKLDFQDIDVRWTTLDTTRYNISAYPTYKPIDVTELIGVNHRISKLTFTITAYLYDFTGQTSNENGYTEHTFNFQVYFSPDTFVNDNIKQSSYAVYTYNDLNPSGETTLDERYNIYDNDYANATKPDGDPKKNQFNVSYDEFNECVMKEIQSKIIEEQYKNYTKMTVKRISPVYDNTKPYSVDESDPNPVWSEDNKTSQTFYVFHKQTVPGYTVPTIDAIEAIKDYLKNLHRTCKNTQTVVDDKLLFIGHGKDNDSIESFLRLMYPDLFEVGVLRILPIVTYIDKSQDAITSKDDAVDLGNYQTTYNIKTVHDTIGRVETDSDSGSYSVIKHIEDYSTMLEMFNLGITHDKVDVSVTNKLLPFVCVTKEGTSQHPFTSVPGFENYTPIPFTSSPDTIDSDDPSVKFQLIVAGLYDLASISDDGTKAPNTVGGVDDVVISFSHDQSWAVNSSITMGKTNYANKASFIINSVSYIVYALPHTYYCNLDVV